MPSGTHEVELNISIDSIWDFVKDMNNWAPLVPGYIDHNILNDNQSTWTFKGDLGIMQKKIKLQIDITAWQEPNLVTFDLKGLNENFAGTGYFKAEAISISNTKMSGNLDITAHGMMARVVNPVLKLFVPKTATELTNNIANKLKEINPV
ncbi:CoxG family protein [Aquibacillus salsiterrae]|uniref:SRPBCC family protein n=1 Tax=Aquibacillus salsiterrae TaxID=2950439 RepID=A0A9X3WJK2_9BACI|nr:SRPBCC family protein [Aquibacillus salsiterrae]MDC3418246.1 SRPBCC family protein [Aquibacillus salsiterrae]